MSNEQLYVLGTGNANVVRCYNTCFAIQNGAETLLVDAGGGNGILKILEEMGIPIPAIHDIILTHEHTDHILGVVWMVREAATAMRQGLYEGNLTIWGHDVVLAKLRTICELIIQKKDCAMFDKRILLRTVSDGETCAVGSYPVTFFDILSTKAKQYGFTLPLHNGRRLTCLGDEPYNPACQRYAEGADWLLSEAFCLYEDREIFRPYEKHHSTVKDAAELASRLGVKNLVLWHTEDTDITHRKERYTREAQEQFTGNIFVPDDREILEL